MELWISLERISERDEEPKILNALAEENWTLRKDVLDGQRGLTDVALRCELASKQISMSQSKVPNKNSC